MIFPVHRKPHPHIYNLKKKLLKQEEKEKITIKIKKKIFSKVYFIKYLYI